MASVASIRLHEITRCTPLAVHMILTASRMRCKAPRGEDEVLKGLKEDVVC